METLNKGYRHGDVVLEMLAGEPDDKGIESMSDVLEVGAGASSPHRFSGGTFYTKKNGEFTLGYLHADNTVLIHNRHGDGEGEEKTVSIQNGWYRIVKQNESYPDGMRPVID